MRFLSPTVSPRGRRFIWKISVRKIKAKASETKRAARGKKEVQTVFRFTRWLVSYSARWPWIALCKSQVVSPELSPPLFSQFPTRLRKNIVRSIESLGRYSFPRNKPFSWRGWRDEDKVTRKLKLLRDCSTFRHTKYSTWQWFLYANKSYDSANIFLTYSKIPKFYPFMLHRIDKRDMLKKGERTSSEPTTNTIYINSMKNNESTNNKGNFIGRWLFEQTFIRCRGTHNCGTLAVGTPLQPATWRNALVNTLGGWFLQGRIGSFSPIFPAEIFADDRRTLDRLTMVNIFLARRTPSTTIDEIYSPASARNITQFLIACAVRTREGSVTVAINIFRSWPQEGLSCPDHVVLRSTKGFSFVYRKLIRRWMLIRAW